VTAIGPEEDAFLRASSRVFLVGTRADGSPTGWPMVGLYPGGALEFSTYGTSQKVKDFTRNPAAACVVAPLDGERALVLRGSCATAGGQHEPSTGGSNPPADVRVADGIAEGARARMLSGKRVVLRFAPEHATFVPGWAAEEPGDG
jgi:hypothetical protein